MSKAKPKDDLRAEYDLDELGRGVTGKYHRRAVAGTNLVLLDADVADVFPDAEAVNRALRLLIDVAASNKPAAKRRVTRSSVSLPAAVKTKAKPGGTSRAG